MNGVGGTLASSTKSLLEQFGQLVCTSYLSIKLSISEVIVRGVAAPFDGPPSGCPPFSMASLSFRLGALVA
jgi:hypothetical protein